MVRTETSVPRAIRADDRLYEGLALVDAIRIGPRARTQARRRPPPQVAGRGSASAANLELVATVARRLDALRARVVFVGGATTALLVTAPASPSIRATRDVDVIVEVASYLSCQLALGEELRHAGFAVDVSEGAPLRHWIVDVVKVDVMPTDTSALGFSNRWYPEALRHATEHALAPGLAIRVVTAPYFLATRREAFRGPR